MITELHNGIPTTSLIIHIYYIYIYIYIVSTVYIKNMPLIFPQ